MDKKLQDAQRNMETLKADEKDPKQMDKIKKMEKLFVDAFNALAEVNEARIKRLKAWNDVEDYIAILQSKDKSTSRVTAKIVDVGEKSGEVYDVIDQINTLVTIFV
jgi:hypothetical protein